MARQHPLEDVALPPQEAARGVHGRDDVPERFGVWMQKRETMRFLGRPSMGATTAWLRRRGIRPRGDGCFMRLEIERVLAREARTQKRGRHPRSQANLRGVQARARQQVVA